MIRPPQITSRAPGTVGKMLQSLGSRHGEASNPHFRLMPPNDLTEGDLPKVGGPSRSGARFGSLDRGMAMHFSRIAAATEEFRDMERERTRLSFRNQQRAQ
jgi:hypothetical protein